jgi:hypothetical protein
MFKIAGRSYLPRQSHSGKWQDGVSNHSACKMVSLVSQTTGDIYLAMTGHGSNHLLDSNLEMLHAVILDRQLCYV